MERSQPQAVLSVGSFLFTVIDGIAVFECVLSAYRQKISCEKKIIFSATCIVAVHRYFCTGNNNPTMNRQIERTMLGCLGAPHDSLRHIAVPFVAFRPAKGHI